jgi:hypothetical protein
MSRLLPLVLVAVAAATQASALREPWQALFGLPALFVAPGLAPARWLARRDGDAALTVAFAAFWLSLPAAALGWALARVAGGGAWTELAVVGVVTAAGALLPRRPLRWPTGGERLGALGAAALLVVWFGHSAVDIARPLDRYWYLAEVDGGLPEAGTALAPGSGWAEVTPIGEPMEGLTRLRPGGATATLGAGSVPQAVLLHGPVGARVDGLPGGPLVVTADPVEVPDEGPVWRYVGAGVAGRWVREAPAAPLTLTFSAPDASTLYLLPSDGALWTLHGSGELHYAHYYQLLNMVEQLHWAEDRWITDVQPPLWTMVLGPAIGLTHGGQPTANVLFTGVLALAALAGLRFLRTFAPTAPLPAWALPGLAAVATGKLLLEPGSTGMPDALYAVAIVGALAGPAVPLGLAAQLLRYPGYGVVLLGTLLRGARRDALRLTGAVAAAILLFGAGGLATGALDGWLRTVAWETGPEHWHGETAPTALLPRIPEFYRIWLVYAGGTPLLAAFAWPAGTRVALGTALGYSLLLCTVDHTPTHYFVPLVQLAAVACACTATALRPPWARTALAGLGVVGLAWFVLRGELLG